MSNSASSSSLAPAADAPSASESAPSLSERRASQQLPWRCPLTQTKYSSRPSLAPSRRDALRGASPAAVKLHTRATQ
uniref:EDL3 n=1 Tax=Arundo donax TaxID=35708 RepID=A0A0A9AZE3_ARUDO